MDSRLLGGLGELCVCTDVGGCACMCARGEGEGEKAGSGSTVGRVFTPPVSFKVGRVLRGEV